MFCGSFPCLHLPFANVNVLEYRHHLKKNNLNPSNSPVWKMFIQFVTEKPKALLKTAKIFCWLFEGIISRQGKKKYTDPDKRGKKEWKSRFWFWFFHKILRKIYEDILWKILKWMGIGCAMPFGLLNQNKQKKLGALLLVYWFLMCIRERGGMTERWGEG